MPKEKTKALPFNIIMKDSTKAESYRVNEKLFKKIKNEIASYRSCAPKSKPVKCIETGQCFENAGKAKNWLVKNGITNNYSADVIIKQACKGQKKSAYGYHFEFIKT